MAGVFNTTDLTEAGTDGRYVGGAQIGYGGAYINLLFDDDFFQADLTAGWDLTDTFYLGVNATIATNNFFGGALYLQNSFSDDFALGLRGEFFQDEGVGALPAEDDSNIALTLSANYSVGNLTLIPELRADFLDSDAEFILNDDGDTSGTLASFVLAAVYAF